MTNTIQIRLSLGLLVFAIVHAIFQAGMFLALDRLDPPQASTDPQTFTLPTHQGCDYPSCSPSAIGSRGCAPLQQPQAVNMQAQGEIKQGKIKQSEIKQAGTINTVQPCDVCLSIQSTGSGSLPAKRYEIALFLTGDSQSNQLLTWFQNDPGLVKLRKKCAFQIFTSSNPMYRQRFSRVVPVDQFPVVLFQDNRGGHIHAAGKNMIPANPSQMLADMRKGFQLYGQARQATQGTGAMKTGGYSWDTAIDPAMRLTEVEFQDCDDGSCPLDSQPGTNTWRPGQRLRDNLFDVAADSARNAFLWANATEIATIGVIFILVMLIGSVLLKKGS